MKRIALVLATFLALGFSLEVRAEDAKALFVQKCAACHGPDGKGETPMGKKMGAKDLSGEAKDSLPELTKDIEGGKPPKMPAFKDRLTPDQIQLLAKFIQGGLK